MDYHGQFRRAATESGVSEDESARFADLLRFRIRAGDQSDGVRVGQFGGMPHLPAGMPWPSVSPGAPLAFMASLDCAALPRIAGFALPEAGSLLFFLSPTAAFESCSVADEQKFARVVYVPAGVETAAAEPPVDEHDDEPLSGPEHVLFARVEVNLPGWLEWAEDVRSDFQKHLTRDMPRCAELTALVQRLWPVGQSWIGDDLVIGGYSVSAQNSPETQLVDDEEAHLPPGPERAYRWEEAEHRVRREWVPLAQFAVPGEEYVNGRFLIRHEDLAARRFDRALSFCEFTE
ncbi:YwqG family protein [Plantactinospora soyae]|uniref:DUF1963 domain-containing protein n=1 Tax=Plantactinospora soyae TaxID=1544732 RepID=A0A927MC90_9ACTN|nr:YwqG family protein [Plantactinospora soyae]MBE1492078.1 hypothetical protein [Plantactinospora soyae]